VSILLTCRAIIEKTGHDATIETDPSKPTGPYNRVADNALANDLLGWSARTGFYEGLDRTIGWYCNNHDVQEIRDELQLRLMQR